MRLNLDKVEHEIHCYYPASGKKYFDRLRYGTIYHDTIKVVEHPVTEAGVVHDDGKFVVEAAYLKHSVECLGWRVTEPNRRKFDRAKLKAFKIEGPLVRELEKKGVMTIEGERVRIEDVSWIRKGDIIAVVIDTLPCQSAIDLARNAKFLLCESTYLEDRHQLAAKHYHLTAKQAALIAKEADVERLILTHFSARYLDSHEFEKEARPIFPNTYAAEDFKVFPLPY